MIKINGREYNLPDTFLYDLRQEAAALLVDMASDGTMPTAADRDYPQTITRTVPLKGECFWTEPAPVGGTPKIVARWAYLRPDGTTKRMDVALPEAVRSQLASATLTGDAMVSAVYDNTIASVQAALRADWGVVA